MPNDPKANARDGLVLIQQHTDPELLLLRGHGLGAVLGQFSWAVYADGGVVIPAEKLSRATDALQAASFKVAVHKELVATARTGRMPLPLPECSQCHAPYRRAFAANVQPGDVCTECGAELILEQHDPNTEVHGPVRNCPSCGQEVGHAWKFCLCGSFLIRPEQEVVDRRPWRERFTKEQNDINVANGGIDVRSPSPGATPHQIEAQRLYWKRFDAAREAEQRAGTALPDRAADDVTELGDMAVATGFGGLPPDVANIDVEHWGQEQPPPEFHLPPREADPDDGWDSWPAEFDLPE